MRRGNRIVALFPALLGVGGIQQASRLLALALVQIASQCAWSTDFLSLNDSPGDQTFSLNGASVPFSGFGRAKARFALSALARARAHTRIVLAAHPYLALPAAQMKLVRPGLKVIVVSHGIEIWERLPGFRRKAFLKSDVFLAPSRYSLEQIIATQGAPRDKTVRLPWPLSPDFLALASRPETLSIPARFPSGLIVLAAARLAANEKYKGVDQLIRAVAQLAAKLPVLHLVVVGSGDDLPRHEQLSRDLGIAGRVHFFPGLSPAEIAACYSRCDVFALPSTGEGFGFVFLEAMAFAKPVLGAAAGGITDIVEHERNGLLVPPNDLSALLASLERLLTNEQLRAGLGRAGLETVRSKFQFEMFRSRLHDVLLDSGLASNENQ